jgi:hypothetical protein
MAHLVAKKGHEIRRKLQLDQSACTRHGHYSSFDLNIIEMAAVNVRTKEDWDFDLLQIFYLNFDFET